MSAIDKNGSRNHLETIWLVLEINLRKLILGK